MEKLYDLIAEIISYLLNNINPEFYKHYNSRTKKKVDRENEILLRELPELFDRETKGVAGIDEPEALMPGLERMFGLCREEKAFGRLLDLLRKLDIALEKRLRWEFESRQGTHTEECLNPNWNTYRVGLLPRCGCRWERHHRGRQHYDRIDNYLYNFMLIDYRQWEGWRIEHHMLPASLLAGAEREKKLKVAVSPFKNTDDFTVSDYETEEERRFSVTYSGDYDEDIGHVKKIIDQAAEKKADILLFPEMLGNNKMEEEIAEYLQNPGWLNRGSPPSLIVLPTVWENHSNTACLLDRTGGVICRQTKQYSYEREEAVLEDIIPDHTVHLIHGEGVGRIVIMICRDFLTKNYLNAALSSLKATLILIPSYSTGHHDFETEMGALLSEDCCAVWVNACGIACGSKPEDRRVGMVLRAGKERMRCGERYVIFECPEKCRLQGCTRDCLEVCELYFGNSSAFG